MDDAKTQFTQYHEAFAAIGTTVHALSHCANCGAAVSHNYCAMCGQETRLHVPSASEFVHEFIGHYVALEGKLWRTLKLLVVRPGALTAEYLAGRRQRYVLPLRVFLTFSILFFAVLKYSGHMEPVAESPAPGAPHSTENLHVVSHVSKGVPWMQKRLDHFNTLPGEQQLQIVKNGFFAYTPYAMFLLMPVFALYLKLLYLGSGRRYGEHLLFALHANAFAYLTLTLAVLLPWTPVRVALAGWLLAYLPLAMWRVYGGSKLAVALRWICLGLLHMLGIGLAIASAFAFAVMHE